MTNKINTNDAKTLIAIDQHAKSSTLFALDTTTGEIKKKRFTNCPSYADFLDWLDTWAHGPYYFVYESGPCGFALARDLRAAGIACDVIAISSIPRSNKEKVTKDDSVDAKSLLSAIQTNSSTLSCVYVPSVEAEDARDIVRYYHSVSQDLRRAKQRLNSFLLRHGFVYNEKTKSGRPKRLWTQDHYRWLKSISFDTTYQSDVFTTYYQRIQDLELNVKEAREMIDALVQSPAFEKYVSCLCTIKGIGAITALCFCAEVDDFTRFSSGRALASYLGLIPKRHNSGEKNRSGKITKCGDKTLRKSLIEGFSGVGNFNALSPSVRVFENIPDSVRLEIKKANKRILKRRDTLKEKNKSHNIIKVALAKEAVCQMLFIVKALDSINDNKNASARRA